MLSFIKNNPEGSNSQQSASQSEFKLLEGASEEISEEFDMHREIDGSQS